MFVSIKKKKKKRPRQHFHTPRTAESPAAARTPGWPRRANVYNIAKQTRQRRYAPGAGKAHHNTHGTMARTSTRALLTRPERFAYPARARSRWPWEQLRSCAAREVVNLGALGIKLGSGPVDVVCPWRNVNSETALIESVHRTHVHVCLAARVQARRPVAIRIMQHTGNKLKDRVF